VNSRSNFGADGPKVGHAFMRGARQPRVVNVGCRVVRFVGMTRRNKYSRIGWPRRSLRTRQIDFLSTRRSIPERAANRASLGSTIRIPADRVAAGETRTLQIVSGRQQVVRSRRSSVGPYTSSRLTYEYEEFSRTRRQRGACTKKRAPGCPALESLYPIDAKLDSPHRAVVGYPIAKPNYRHDTSCPWRGRLDRETRPSLGC